MIKDYIISVFKDAFDFLGNGISKVRNSLSSATDKVKSFFGFGSDKDKEETKYKENKKSFFDFGSKNSAKELTEIATTSNTATNNYKNNVNKSVVQNINVDARGSEKQAGEFVASLTKDTDDYNNYSNNAQTAQF